MVNTESTFVQSFASYYRPTVRHFDELFESSLIVVDANVLLSLYRVTPAAREEMLKTFEAARERIWVPHQAALEFHRNRIRAAKDQMDFFSGVHKDLEASRKQALQKLGEFANRCALGSEERDLIKDGLDRAFGVAIAQVERQQGKFDLSIAQILNDDPVLARLSVLLDGRVGPALSEVGMTAALKEAEKRRNEEIPPGYKDGAKRSNSAGDYILWEQTLIEAEERKMPVLVVSSDEKEDWVHKQLNFSIGPREELIKEMLERAGVSLSVVSFPRFLEAAKSHFRTKVSSETLDQAKRVNVRSGRNSEDVKRVTVTPQEVEILRKHFVEMREYFEGQRIDAAARLDKARNEGADEDAIELLVDREESAVSVIKTYSKVLEDFEGVVAGGTVDGDGIHLMVRSAMRRTILRGLDAAKGIPSA
ncbi:hypothetical protein IPZ58_21435 [Streptomyces roseoverticillatus]|uniref:PIN-like domain-containing protein n=1 Tax=Streptomyces roseoverticillatus TaxID=66429 RepID=UPI001F3F67B3|nr:PIN-like domain-containing protein [Streptomyces roseoverticillatus]MCF3104132.1 hypothetical protein [Streptomyces roseoverticillatus]